MTTWTMCVCPFSWINPRLKALFHIGSADVLCLKLHFVWCAQSDTIMEGRAASATLCLMCTKLGYIWLVGHTTRKKVLGLSQFYWYRKFITLFTTGYNFSLSWDRKIQFTSTHIIYYSHLCVVLPSSPFPSDFPPQNLYEIFSSPCLSYALKLGAYQLNSYRT